MHRFYLWYSNKGVWYLIFFWTGVPALLGFFEALSFFGMSEAMFNEKYNDGRASDWKDYYDELLKFDTLKERGLISDEEYKLKVADIKNKMQQHADKQAKAKEVMEKIKEDNKNLNKKLSLAFKILGIVLLVIVLIVVSLSVLGKLLAQNDLSNNSALTSMDIKDPILDTQKLGDYKFWNN